MDELTVSHVRQRVSLVRIPSNKLWTRVACAIEVPELDVAASVDGPEEVTEAETTQVIS